MNDENSKLLADRLEALAGSEAYPYHMPGHKRRLDGVMKGRAQADEAGKMRGTMSAAEILAAAANLDITEIDDFDNLHDPEGILQEAMERAARLYGAQDAYFLVNGSTAGLLTAISAAVPEGGKLIMARNCHRAVYHAVYLRKIEPVYLYPDTVPDILTADVVRAEQVEAALKENPDAKAVLVVSPTYDGITADVEAIAEIAHRHKIPLIVDGAHGAHYGFHPEFPKNPAQLGADLTVVSLHKTMPCMTQTALLLTNGNLVDREKIRFFESVYQTSSPSYFFMAGMDACMALVSEKGSSLWDNFFRDREEFLKRTQSRKKLRVITAGSDDFLMDPGKILIDTSKTDLTGKALYDILLLKYHLQMEMASMHYVTAIMTCCDSQEGWRRLAEALLEADEAVGERKEAQMQFGDKKVMRPYPEMEAACQISRALDGPWLDAAFEASEGRISAAFVNLYPPGIPLLVPGERISREALDLIADCRQQGLQIQGLKEDKIRVLL